MPVPFTIGKTQRAAEHAEHAMNFFLFLRRIFGIISLLLVIWCNRPFFDRSDPI